MTDIQPEKPAPTSGEIMNALRIRDELGAVIAQTSGITRDEGKKAAERLIQRGYVDTAQVHRAIIYEDDEDDLFPED